MVTLRGRGQRQRSELPRPRRPAAPLEQAMFRMAAVQLVLMFGTEGDKWRIWRLMNGELDAEAGAELRGRLDRIARNLFTDAVSGNG
jgi:hypothetical protein